MDMFKKRSAIWIVLMVFALLGACATVKKEPRPAAELSLKKMALRAYPRFCDDMDFDGLDHSLRQSLLYLENVPPDREYRFGKDLYTAAHLVHSLNAFRQFIRSKPSAKELETFIRAKYLVYRSTGRKQTGEVLFTGYYEPFLSGRTQKDNLFRFPVYARPDDLVTIDLSLFSSRFEGINMIGRYTGKTIVPYFDRKQIDTGGRIEDRACRLAWISDLIDVFFLHIQGSGKIVLENGHTLNVHYDVANGHPYKSIGRLLIDQGKIKRADMSMQKIRSYLQNHPAEIEGILNANPSYVFFKVEPDGPKGFLDVPLTPARSIAVDRRLFPMPALAFIESRQPLITGDGKIDRWIDCRLFSVSQDTGGAIRGPGRADVFWGNGPYAEIAAGHMQHVGQLYFLVLKPDG